MSARPSDQVVIWFNAGMSALGAWLTFENVQSTLALLGGVVALTIGLQRVWLNVIEWRLKRRELHRSDGD